MSDARSLIFVHIQRTGGTAIRQALGLTISPPDKHRTAAELRESLGEKAFDAKFKFAFVRNPWERLVSWWSLIDAMRPRHESGARLNRFQTFVLEHAKSFDEFLENCADPISDDDGDKWIYRNQADYITDQEGKLLVDFVGRYESLERDFADVAARLGKPNSTIARVNGSSHGHYASYYSSASAAKVAEYYERDLITFGYSFGS